MHYSIQLILISICGIIFGQLFLKVGMSKIGKIKKIPLNEVLPLALHIITRKQVLIGLSFYISSSVLWVYILSFTDLSFAFPFLSIAYVGVPTAAALILHEQVPLKQWIGVMLVVIGVVCIASTN